MASAVLRQAAQAGSDSLAVRKPMHLSLPSFTFGLDVVLLMGQLRLGQHQTVDEIHQRLVQRLASLQQSMMPSRKLCKGKVVKELLHNR